MTNQNVALKRTLMIGAFVKLDNYDQSQSFNLTIPITDIFSLEFLILLIFAYFYTFSAHRPAHITQAAQAVQQSLSPCVSVSMLPLFNSK